MAVGLRPGSGQGLMLPRSPRCRAVLSRSLFFRRCPPVAPGGGGAVVSRRLLPGFLALLPSLLSLLLLLFLLIAGCAPLERGARPRTYAYQVPLGVTFDLREGRALTSERLAARLRGVRLLFLGEHHTSRASHRFQEEVVERLVAQGRRVILALEMLPPSADPALERWRGEELEEAAFLEASGWYRHWGFAWGYYRRLFLLARRHRLRLHGVNVEREEREAVAEKGPEALPPALREEIGKEEPAPDLAALYLEDTLRRAGHPNAPGPGSPEFQRFRRVQWLWDRAMGVRAARLAQQAGPEAVVVVLIGSGHLAYKLGANLQAARESTLPQLTVWDRLVEKADGKAAPPRITRVALGMADWVRLYEHDPEQPPIPLPAGLRLEPHPQGARVKAITPHAADRWAGLRGGDVILALEDKPVAGPAALRLAWEKLDPAGKATLTVFRPGEKLRGGKKLRLSVPVTAPVRH